MAQGGCLSLRCHIHISLQEGEPPSPGLFEEATHTLCSYISFAQTETDGSTLLERRLESD